jgi:hypothetical protein
VIFLGNASKYLIFKVLGHNPQDDILFHSGSKNALTTCMNERNARMEKTKRVWHLNLVNVLVGIAVLMILSALVVPIFVPPDGRAASRAAITGATTNLPQR